MDLDMGRSTKRRRAARPARAASKAEMAPAPAPQQRRWTQELVCKELRRLAAARVPLRATAIRKLDQALYRAIRRQFGTFRAALFVASLEAAAAATPKTWTLPAQPPPKRAPLTRAWSKRAICEELRRLADAGVHISSDSVRKHDPGLASAIYSHYSGFTAARRAAGLDRPPPPLRRWSAERIETALRAWAADHGALNRVALGKGDFALLKAAERHFGSLQKAAQALKLPYHSRRRHWTRAAICEELRKLAGEEVHLSMTTVDERDPNLRYAIYRRFPDFAAALIAAGLQPVPAGPRRWKPDVLAAALRAWVEKHGPLIGARLRETDPALFKAVRAPYGTVARAAEALGLPCRSLRTVWDRTTICDSLRRLAREQVRLSAGNVKRLDISLYHAIGTHFDSFEAALVAARLSAAHPTRPRWSKELCGEALELWVERIGPLSAVALQRRDPELLAATKRYFGSLSRAARQLRLPCQRDEERR